MALLYAKHAKRVRRGTWPTLHFYVQEGVLVMAVRQLHVAPAVLEA